MANNHYGASPESRDDDTPLLSTYGMGGDRQTVPKQLDLEMSELGKPISSRAAGLFEAVRDGIVDAVNDKLRSKHNVAEINKLNESGLALLHQAARYGRVEVAKALLNHGAQVDVRSRDDSLTPLHVASRFNRIGTVRLLLQTGANPSLRSANGSNALHLAARLGNEEVAELLVNLANVDVNSKDAMNMTALHWACSSGNETIAKRLLDRGADITAKTTDLMTPLHCAVHQGHEQCAALILSTAAEISQNIDDLVRNEDIKGNTVLHHAAGTNDLQTVEVCLKNGADINVRNNSDETPLFVAAVKGNLQMVELLVQRGADVGAKNADSKTVLHRAAVFNREDIILFLLGHGIPVDSSDSQSATPFLNAVAAGQTKCAKLLIQKGANIRAINIYMKNCIHMAVENQNLETLSMLLEEPEALWNLNRPDVRERVPLHYAAIASDIRIMNALLEKQTRFKFDDENQQTPLHLAAQCGHFAHVEALARRMASGMDERDQKGRSPLHNAAMHGHRKVCYSLVKLGADIHSKDNKHWTPLMAAAKNGYNKTCQELLNQQASPDDVNMEGDTALHIAGRQGHVIVVKLLLDQGANMTISNTQGLSCLEAAAKAGASDVIMAIIKHSRWTEIMEHKDIKEQTPMKFLIENFPECAGVLMDRCIKRSEKISATEPEFTITYDFHLLDPGPDDPAAVHGRRFFGPSAMVKHERKGLLLHPLTKALLKQKWSTFGRFIYYFNFFSYLMFVSLYSAFLISERFAADFDQECTLIPKYDENGYPTGESESVCFSLSEGYGYQNIDRDNLNATYKEEGPDCQVYYTYDYYDNGSNGEAVKNVVCNSLSEIYNTDTLYNIGFSYIVFIFAVVHLVKEILQVFIQRHNYFLDVSNFLEWGLYGTAVVFLSPYVLSSSMVDFLLRGSKDPYFLWTLGVFSIFLCYMNLVLFLRRFRIFGIYVTMFVEVLKTVVRVFLVLSVLVVGFAIVFFILFKEQEAFNDPMISLFKVLVMMTGEFDFDDTFIKTIGENSNSTGKPLNPFPAHGFLLLAFFLFLMTIVLMNLLVGLAVGDIDTIQQNATLKRLAMQVEFVVEIENSYPRFITRRLYRPTMAFRPNVPSRWKRLMAMFGIKRRTKKAGVELPFPEEDSRTTELEVVRDQMDRTRKRVKILVNVIEAQNRLLRRLVRRIDPTDEMDALCLGERRTGLAEEIPTVDSQDYLDGQVPQQSVDKMTHHIAIC